jgi:hypothetical protein
MCTGNIPKAPKPVVVPPPPPAPILGDAATDNQSAAKRAVNAPRSGLSLVRKDLTVPYPGLGSSGLNLPR